MKPENLEWRMYGLVPYNLSPIQQGIQYGHAVQEFNNMLIEARENLLLGKATLLDEGNFQIQAFDKWRNNDKTFIILNGGTTNKNRDFNSISQGSLNRHADSLEEQGKTFAYFEEPDLGDQLTAVVFLVDERVFDKKKYPDFEEFMLSIPVDDKLVSIDLHFDNYWKAKWIDSLGGKRNAWLREFLSQFRLA